MKVSDDQLKKLVEHWESTLFHNQYLLSSATTYLIEATVSSLKELQGIRGSTDRPEITTEKSSP